MKKLIITWSLFGAVVLAQDPEPARVISVIPATGWNAAHHFIARSQIVKKDEGLSGFAGAELVLECRRGWVRYVCETGTCDMKGPCLDKDHVPFKNGVDELGTWLTRTGTRLSDALFQREPKEILTLGVRAGGNPSDALLLLNGQGIHFGAALNRVLEGQYCFRLTSLPAGSSRTFGLDWNRSVDGEGTALLRGVEPGLYVIEKGAPAPRGVCSIDRDGGGAWVLVVPEGQFSLINAEWKVHNSRISQLERSDAGPAAAATLRHAVLASLAEAVATK